MNKIFGAFTIFLMLGVLQAQDEVELGMTSAEGELQSKVKPQKELTARERFEYGAFTIISIDPKIFTGQYLIYDCERKRYVCVDDYTNDSCIESREKSRSEKGNTLDCAPLKKFASYYDCTQANYKAVSDAKALRFCYKN